VQARFYQMNWRDVSTRDLNIGREGTQVPLFF
jgi:hypothetical protein